MPIEISRLRDLQDHRVRMHFDDGQEVVATLLSTSEDFDGSLHVVDDQVEWASGPRPLASSKNLDIYAEGESIVSIAPEPPQV